MKAINTNRAFTLVETLISVAIFLTVMVMVMVVISTARISYFNAEARITAQENIRKALGIMIREIAESSPGKIDIPEPSTLIFQIPVSPTSGPLAGETVDGMNNIIFGAKSLPSTLPDGTEDYAIEYTLVPNNDISESNRLVRRILDDFPNGNQVGNDYIVANFIDSIEFVHQNFPPDYNDNDSNNVTICHHPVGNPSNARTITVARSALNAHLAHGDTIGRCSGDTVTLPSSADIISIIVTSNKKSKLGRDMQVKTKFCVALRN